MGDVMTNMDEVAALRFNHGDGLISLLEGHMSRMRGIAQGIHDQDFYPACRLHRLWRES